MKNEVYEFLKTISDTIICDDESIGEKIDFYCSTNKLAVCYQSLIEHSSCSQSTDDFNFRRHKKTADLCNLNGIQVFQIWENEWKSNRIVWESMLRNAFKRSKRIYARNCEVKLVDSAFAREFCNKNHMQKFAVSSINIALEYDEEIVAIMTFSKSRYSKSISSYELVRFCNKLNVSVVGGASKIIKAFKKMHSGVIVSYANRRWSNGNLYNTLGFKYESESEPCYYYFKDINKLEHRSAYMKHKLINKIDVFDENLTEVQNMYINKYHRIWDAGNIVYLLE